MNNNNNIVKNEEQQVPSGIEMNDRDFLYSILTVEKNMSNNYATILNEISNDNTYDELTKVFKDTQDCQRRLFNLYFKKGWYELEKADQNKVQQKFDMFNQKLEDIE